MVREWIFRCDHDACPMALAMSDGDSISDWEIGANTKEASVATLVWISDADLLRMTARPTH